MRLDGKVIGWGVTGSHCSYDEVILQVERVLALGASVIPVMSHTAVTTTTRFGSGEDLAKLLRELTGHEPITTIVDAEPTGQQRTFDCFVIAPLTGNSLARFANAFTDSAVLMAAKGTLRNLRPVVLAISTNDALGNNARNLAMLLNMKNIYFVPFGQDNPHVKPNSCVAAFDLIPETIAAALEGRQLQPVLIERAQRPVR